MSFTVIHDLEKDVAALVDAEFGRALGPIATGEKAVELLESFASAHGVDPATIPTGELEARWKDFVTALTGEVHDIEGEVHRVADEVLHPGADLTKPAASADVPAEPATHPSAAAEGMAPAAPATGEPAAADLDSAQAGLQKAGPVTEPQAGYEVCPTCDGWREVPSGAGVATCPTCQGKGEIPVKLDTGASHAEA